MKRKSYKFNEVLIILLTNLLISSSIFAQSPDKMSYQAVIRNTGDALVANTQVGMQISILQGTAEGLSVYTETQTPTTNANGLVSLEIGTGTSSDDFSLIDWSAGPYFIKTETDPDGDTDYTITGTSELLSVPYALHANTAANVDDLETRLDSLISALSPPVAAFSADETTIIVDGTVQFTDESTNIPTSWSWDFGDGSAESTEQNPSHVYTIVGIYTVTLTATNENGTDDEEKTNYITVNPPPPVADFSSDVTEIVLDGSVSFTDESTNSPTSWSWDFGDLSAGSTDQNPSHVYTIAGTYTVTLTATNVSGSDDEEKTDYITVYPEGFIADVDGNIYSTVTIGTQVWMAENLKVTHYSNNDPIPEVTGNTNWANLTDDNTTKAYCWVNDDKPTYEFYGALYTYAAATNGDNSGSDVQGACPVGWHLPNDAEWSVLYNSLDGMGGNSGSKLAGDEALWTDGLLDESVDFGLTGFNAIPSGGRSNTDGIFSPAGEKAYFWSSTEANSNEAGKIELDYNYSGIFRHNIHYKSGGISIRCVKD